VKEQHKCCGRVWSRFGFHTCSRNAKYEHEGKWFCKTHHPPTVQQKLDARNAAWEKDFEARQRAHGEAQAAKAETDRRAALYPELLEALKDIVNIDPVDAALDPQRAVRVARAIITKAQGEKT
jgi:hypothetical protein